MNTIDGQTLTSALETSQQRMHDAATIAAGSATTVGRGAAQATLAQESLFADAMLASMRARVAAWKEVLR